VPGASTSFASALQSLGQRVAAVVAGQPPEAQRDNRHVVLRVEHGELSVLAEGRRAQAIALRDLLDVELDTRSIEKSQPQVRPDGVMDTGQSLSLDVSRLALVVADRDGVVLLSDAYASYSESLEWLGKVRQFLRRFGWVPEDERDR
jgi:hypothetical protein